MFKRISIKNFKAFGEVQEFNLAPITLIFGRNSGGKSSIIHSLLLMKQSVEAKTNSNLWHRYAIPKGAYVDLGQSKSMHHLHSFDNQIELGFDFKIDDSKIPFRKKIFKGDSLASINLKFSSKIDEDSQRAPVLLEVGYGLKNFDLKKVFSIQKRIRKKSIDKNKLLDDISQDEIVNSNLFEFSSGEGIKNFKDILGDMPDAIVAPYSEEYQSIDNCVIGYRPTISGKISYLPTGVRSKDKKFNLFNAYLDNPSNILHQFAYIFNSHFENFSYLGPLRSRPKRMYKLSHNFQGSIGSSGEFIVDALISNSKKKKGHFLKFVNSWMQKLDIPYELTIEEVGDEVFGDIAKIKIKDLKSQVDLAITDVGFGIGQVLPILIEGALALNRNSYSIRRNTTHSICVEQPEIHLHPKLQANLADFFISTAAKGRCQWIVETHSEAIMLRIQRRIREGKIKSEDVSVVFVDPQHRGGSSIINIRLDELGNFIDEWPGGFFEERFMEMFS